MFAIHAPLPGSVVSDTALDAVAATLIPPPNEIPRLNSAFADPFAGTCNVINGVVVPTDGPDPSNSFTYSFDDVVFDRNHP
jgi:hypothetical protein